MNRWILGIIALFLMFTLQCGRKIDAEDQEAIRRHTEGMERVLEAARAFRHKVQTENRANQPGGESPRDDQGRSRITD